MRTPFASPLLVTLSPCDSRRCPSNLPEIFAFWALVAPVRTPAHHTSFTRCSILQYDRGDKGGCQETRTLPGSFTNISAQTSRMTTKIHHTARDQRSKIYDSNPCRATLAHRYIPVNMALQHMRSELNLHHVRIVNTYTKQPVV